MTVTCPRCGHENPQDALLCGTCRAYLGWARPAAGTGAAPAAAPPTEPESEHPGVQAAAGPAPAVRTGPGTTGRTTTGYEGTGGEGPARPRPAATAPAPIAVPLDRSGAPRAVQVPAGTTPRVASRPAPARPAPGADPLTAPRGTSGPTTGAGPAAVGAPAHAGAPTDAAAPTTADAPDEAARPAARTGRSTWSPPTSSDARAVTQPGAAAGAPTDRPPTGPGARPAPAGGPTPVQVVLGPSPERPTARTAPPRSIGVRVAAGPSRIEPRALVTDAPRRAGFEALPPTAADEAPGPTARPTAGAARRPDVDLEDAVRCPSCGRALPASRRFCRCGAALAPRTLPDEEDAAPPVPWRHRLLGGGRSFRRRMRAANQGVRVVFDRGRAAQVHVTRATAALAAVGLAGVVVLPQASDVRGQVRAVALQADPRGYTRVVGVTAATDPPAQDAAADPVFGPGNAVDGATGRAWSAPWVPPVDAGPPCGRAGGAPALVLTFPGPTPVERVGVVAGLPPTAPDRTRQAVPALVDVTWLPSGRCTTLELADTGELQVQDVAEVRDATSARVVVVDAHLPQDPPADLRVAVAELVVMTHGRWS